MIDLPPLLGRARALVGSAILGIAGSLLVGTLLLLLLRRLRLGLLFRLRGSGGIGVVAILLGILRRRHNRGRSSIRFLCGGSLCSLNHRMGLCRSGRRGLRIGTAHGQAHSRRRRRVGASEVAEAWRACARHLRAVGAACWATGGGRTAARVLLLCCWPALLTQSSKFARDCGRPSLRRPAVAGRSPAQPCAKPRGRDQQTVTAKKVSVDPRPSGQQPSPSASGPRR